MSQKQKEKGIKSLIKDIVKFIIFCSKGVSFEKTQHEQQKGIIFLAI